MRILITAGPTREYFDDVRFLSNASSGQMGYAIAAAARSAGHDVVLVSGPVALPVPNGCEVHHIETTGELQETCLKLFPACDGVIATAAVCDYRPRERVTGKISKSGKPVSFELVETADVLAELGAAKENRWVIGFALESQDPRQNAMRKLKMKKCNYIVLNDTSAISSPNNEVELLNPEGETIKKIVGSKPDVASELVAWIDGQFN